MAIKHFAKKKWGQNFLADTNLLKRIVRTINPQPTDNVLEIGPGEGALTELLLPEVGNLAAIEIDPRLVEYLKSLEHLRDCNFIHGDVLWQKLAELPIPTPVRVMGNIPYNITSPILFWLIEQRQYWTDAFLMVQREVAERLTGKVGTKAYGRLTVMVGAFLKVEYCFTIPPTVFQPRPKVDSAIIALRKLDQPIVSDAKFERFEKLVGAAFSKRRKMLRNSLAGFKLAVEGLQNIELTRRPETLTIEEFASLIP